MNVTLERFVEGTTLETLLTEPFNLVLVPDDTVELRFTLPTAKAGVWTLSSSGAASSTIVN